MVGLKSYAKRPKRRRAEDEDVIRFDFDMNYTLELDGDTWRDLLELHEGDREAAIEQLTEEMESEFGEEPCVSGRAWPCGVTKPLSVIEDFTRKEATR